MKRPLFCLLEIIFLVTASDGTAEQTEYFTYQMIGTNYAMITGCTAYVDDITGFEPPFPDNINGAPIAIGPGWLGPRRAGIAGQSGPYSYVSNGTNIVITKYTAIEELPGDEVIIPATIAGLPVTTIGMQAFKFLGYARIVIPEGVTLIGYEAFCDCHRLSSIDIPNSVVALGNRAFLQCYGLTSVTIGNSVTNIGDEAFCGCLNLQSITIPGSVTSIGNLAFAGCRTVKSVVIPSSVKSIGSGAFSWCASLSSLTLQDGVATIKNNAFARCNSLASVYSAGNAPQVESGVFDLANSASVYYRPGTLGWGETLAGRPAILWNPVIAQLQQDRENLCFSLKITASANLPIAIDVTTNLITGPWLRLHTTTLVNGSLDFQDPTSANCPVRFYRISAP